MDFRWRVWAVAWRTVAGSLAFALLVRNSVSGDVDDVLFILLGALMAPGFGVAAACRNWRGLLFAVLAWLAVCQTGPFLGRTLVSVRLSETWIAALPYDRPVGFWTITPTIFPMPEMCWWGQEALVDCGAYVSGALSDIGPICVVVVAAVAWCIAGPREVSRRIALGSGAVLSMGVGAWGMTLTHLQWDGRNHTQERIAFGLLMTVCSWGVIWSRRRSLGVRVPVWTATLLLCVWPLERFPNHFFLPTSLSIAVGLVAARRAAQSTDAKAAGLSPRHY